ncbi:MAG: hypothetical protein ACTSUF_07995 [Candidatus Heimdallarchaeaceae archaeon]
MSLTSNQFLSVLDSQRGEWVNLCARLGVPNHYVNEVIQNCYLALWRYVKPEKVTDGKRVSHGYMYMALKSGWIRVRYENKKANMVSCDNLDYIVENNEPYNEQERENHFIYENQLKWFSDEISRQLGEFSRHHLRFYKIYTSASNPSYRELEKATGISYMTFWNDMNIIKSKILIAENQALWDSIKHEYRI